MPDNNFNRDHLPKREWAQAALGVIAGLGAASMLKSLEAQPIAEIAAKSVAILGPASTALILNKAISGERIPGPIKDYCSSRFTDVVISGRMALEQSVHVIKTIGAARPIEATNYYSWYAKQSIVNGSRALAAHL